MTRQQAALALFLADAEAQRSAIESLEDDEIANQLRDYHGIEVVIAEGDDENTGSVDPTARPNGYAFKTTKSVSTSA